MWHFVSDFFCRISHNFKSILMVMSKYWTERTRNTHLKQLNHIIYKNYKRRLEWANLGYSTLNAHPTVWVLYLNKPTILNKFNSIWRLGNFGINPNTSLRIITVESGISLESAYKIRKFDDLFSQKNLELCEADFDKIVQSCEQMELIKTTPTLVMNAHFT